MNDWFVDDTDGSHRENLYNELGNQYYRYLKNVMHNVGGIYLTEEMCIRDRFSTKLNLFAS